MPEMDVPSLNLLNAEIRGVRDFVEAKVDGIKDGMDQMQAVLERLTEAFDRQSKMDKKLEVWVTNTQRAQSDIAELREENRALNTRIGQVEKTTWKLDLIRGFIFGGGTLLLGFVLKHLPDLTHFLGG